VIAWAFLASFLARTGRAVEAWPWVELLSIRCGTERAEVRA
jgi:hypothetical protein